MQRILFVALMAMVLFIASPGVMASAPKHQSQVLILSSTEKQYPMQYVNQETSEFEQVGYNVTFLTGNTITLSQLAAQLDHYDIVIWRTDTYFYGNTTYWYLGQPANQTVLAAYGKPSGAITAANGLLAVSADYFDTIFGPKSLANVKLAIVIASTSHDIAQEFIAAGVETTIDLYPNYYYPTLNVSTSLFDWVIQAVVGYLTTGSMVKDAVYNTIYNYEYASSLDDSYLPPVQYLGNGFLQITQ